MPNMPNQLRVISEVENMPRMRANASISPASFDEKNKTVRVTYTTGVRVLREGFIGGSYQRFYEELSTDPKHMRLDYINSGRAPFLKDHRQNIDNVLGVIVQGSATTREADIRFSETDEDAQKIMRKVVEGILRNVSVGYTVHKFLDVTEEEDEVRVLRAIDWEPGEISLVAIGADDSAFVRSGQNQETNKCQILTARADEPKQEEKPMPNPNPAAPETEVQNPAPASNPTPAPAAVPPADVEAERSKAIQGERERVSSIQAAVRKAKLPDEFAAELVTSGASMDQVRAKIFDKVFAEDTAPTNPQVKVGTDLKVEGNMRGIENALLSRHDGVKFKLDDAGRMFRGMSLREIARQYLQDMGVDTRGMNSSQVAVAALETRFMHSTSDFPNILSNVANKTLRAGYEERNETFKAWARPTTAPDFKDINRLQLSEAPALDLVQEGGEYKYGTLGEGAEKYRLFTYGKILAITRETIVNDDLDAFTRIPSLLGRSAARLEGDLMYALLLANAGAGQTMGDGQNLFIGSNTTNATLSLNGFGTARAVMRKQKGLAGVANLNLSPRYMLVNSDWEMAALKLRGEVFPTDPAYVNPYRNSYEVITESRLDGNGGAYYLVADKADIDTAEYAHLEGQEGPYIETKTGFERDGVQIKVRHDFAGRAIDRKAFVKSTNNA